MLFILIINTFILHDFALKHHKNLIFFIVIDLHFSFSLSSIQSILVFSPGHVCTREPWEMKWSTPAKVHHNLQTLSSYSFLDRFPIRSSGSVDLIHFHWSVKDSVLVSLCIIAIDYSSLVPDTFILTASLFYFLDMEWLSKKRSSSYFQGWRLLRYCFCHVVLVLVEVHEDGHLHRFLELVFHPPFDLTSLSTWTTCVTGSAE